MPNPRSLTSTWLNYSLSKADCQSSTHNCWKNNLILAKIGNFQREKMNIHAI